MRPATGALAVGGAVRRAGLSTSLCLSLGVLAAACGRADAPPTDMVGDTASAIAAARTTTPAAGVSASPTTSADTMTVVVEGPTIVAFVPAGLEARVDADSTGEVATVTDDFFHYFAEATGSLSDMGVKWRVREADTLAFARGDRRWTWAPPADSSYVGYYLASPGTPPLVLYGVHVDDELVELVAGHLGVPVPPKEQRR